LTTIINPTDPTIVLRDGATTVHAVEAAGSSHSDAVTVPLTTIRTLVEVDCNSSAKGVKITGAEIGDAVTMIKTNAETFKVYSEAGALITSDGANRTFTLYPSGWNYA
jgi:hypothetical protein